ncbi:MotA/TolQ/ExbB proton channel family protein [Bacteroidales bacterium OttesenSCG-928-C19]|nr:MotA/TolQ/ExbB proton channel family protein [Bacteroidales bacterium OttesenSCG-928-C19]
MFLQINQVGETVTAVAAEAATSVEKLSLINLASKGGWIMIVLAIMLVYCIYLFIERYLALNRALKDDSTFMNSIREYIFSGNIDSARTLAKNTSTPIARMIDKGLSRLGRPLNDIQTAIENVGQLEVARLEKQIWLIATIAGLGPMIGFLGTVTGMVRAFFDMANAGNNIDIQILSSGIYEAMVTTVGGLIVGIIAYFFYNLLVARVNKVVLLLEDRTTEFMDLLNEPAK